MDIRPFIYQMEACDSGVFMQLASASSNYTKPELVMDTFVRWLDKEPQEFAYMIERREVYADAGEDKNPRFLPLEALGEKLSKLIITELKLWGCSSIVCAVAENQKIMELRLEAAGKKVF